MRTKLSLTVEHLSELTTDDLAAVAGGSPQPTYTGTECAIQQLKAEVITVIGGINIDIHKPQLPPIVVQPQPHPTLNC